MSLQRERKGGGKIVSIPNKAQGDSQCEGSGGKNTLRETTKSRDQAERGKRPISRRLENKWEKEPTESKG